MKEIEILVEVLSDKDEALKKLSAFTFLGEKHVLDIYYTDPLRQNLKPDASGRLTASFRLRSKDDKALMTYKIDHFNGNGIWVYSDEYEIKISDFEVAEHIIANLNLKELVRIDNYKFTYETPEYEIVLENVIGLGLFLEVELRSQVADDQVDAVKRQIQKFIDSLDIKVSDELNAGKPELMLRKKQPT
jgi:adenylyl cyclase CyaB, putative